VNGRKIDGTDYKRTLYKIKYKCKYCPKTKYACFYYDVTDKNIIAEFDFWLKDNKKE